MTKKLLSFLMLLIAYTGTLRAQSDCGFDAVHAKMMVQDSMYRKSVNAFNAQWAAKMAASSSSLITTTVPKGTVYEIPVVIHVMHTGGSVGTTYNPSDAQLTGMIDYLNQSYAATYSSYPDTNSGGVYFPVKFVLAKRSPSCASTSGINRIDCSSNSNYVLRGINLSNTSGVDEGTIKALSRWDNNEYYNIWIVNKIDSNDGTFGTFTAGYAYFPGASYTIDGTVMLATQATTGKITLPHEIGHAFNLYHTFQGDGTGSTCPTNTNCNTDGDQVCDTEPHKRSPFNCPSDPNPCTGVSYNNVQRNFMDYSNCQSRFTVGQRTRWLDGLLNSRPGLASSNGGLAPSTSMVAANCVTTSSNPTNTFGMGPVKVTLNDMTSSSAGFNLDGFAPYVDRSCTQRANLVQGQTYTLSVNTTTNIQKVNVFIDYNNDGSFASGELVFSNTGTTANQTHSTSYTVPGTGVTTCTPLRMRVVADFVSATLPSNGCGALQYGQAEDFSVFVKPASANITLTNALTSGTNPSCTGSSLTFTATPSASLTSPSYSWYVNGVLAGTGTTYTTTTIANASWVQCKVTFTGTCGADSAFSNIIGIGRTSGSVTPSVSISANPSNSVCAGTNVTFTAIPTNGGSSPSYQWKVNGSNVGTNSSTYSSTSFATGDQVTCVMTSNAACASPTTATSNTVTMTVTPNVTPSVSISANPGNTICAGTNVTFTATPTNGGTPSYQWKVNGGNVGTNSSTYSTTGLANGDIVTCLMTSTTACVSPSSATSTGITMTVNSTVTPSVSISANPGTTICSGTSVTFTATPTNGGTTPSYQWKLNGSNVGTNSPTYTNASLANGNTISCVMTSNANCASPATATSSTLTMTVNSTVTPSVSISANPGNTICTGTSVTFTATPTNGGSTPSYQWKLNGGNVGTNSSTYTNASLANGDQVSCVMTSSSSCASPTTATSSTITMTVNPAVTPAVSISANPGSTICASTSVTFTATPTNGGSTPSYQWKLNGSNVGTNSTTYTNAALATGDVVTCVMTSNAACATTSTATSNAITITVNPTVAPSVSIVANTGSSICTGAPVTFTATPTNGGGSPSYQWKLNGSNVGTNSPTYNNATLANGDQVTCVMTSNLGCASPAAATSNIITMSVSSVITPSVAVAAAPGSTICAGTSVTFTATPTNGGATPGYQWKLNGSNVGTNSPTYTNTALANGNTISCVMTSSASCASPTTATSSTITMTVNPIVTPSVSISANPGNNICTGTSVTFTATPTNGGASPSYQWKVNGGNVGTNSATYTSSSLANGDVVTCVMTSNAPCPSTPSVVSNFITMTVSTVQVPAVSVSTNPGSTICAGTSVTFTATPVNGGATPSYQWKLNGSNVGTNSNTYTNASLANGNTVAVVMTSSSTCAVPATATSTTVTMTVNPIVTPSVSISANPGNTICAGSSVTFTATPTNGGATPAYQWKVNGVNVGTNSPTYTTATLANGNVVTCVMTSSASCISTSTATSAGITMTVNPILVPSVSISANPGNTICAGTSVTFTATPTNGGATPGYQWRVNGSPVGTNSPTYTTNTLTNGNVVTCVMTTSATCPSTPTATSAGITMTVNPLLVPSVSISANTGSSICAGASVTFTATPVNGGATPTYQWRVNGSPVGTNSPTYTTNTLANGNVVSCVMTSSGCASPASGTSNNITMTVTPNVTPSVSISANTGNTICAGRLVTFTATPVNGGVSPAYQWKINGSNVGTNSPFFSTTTLANGDQVTCVLTSSVTCVTSNTATSNAINMTVNPLTSPTINVTLNTGNTTICTGGSVTFTANITNGGTSQTYAWTKNGLPVGGNSNTYTTTSIGTGDVFACTLTITATCPNPATVASVPVTMTVVTPVVDVSVLPNDTVCSATPAVFAANVSNGGNNQLFQWKRNGVDIVGAVAPTFTLAPANNGDVITAVMVSSSNCIGAPKTGNDVTMRVNGSYITGVSITAKPDTNIAPGTNVTFTSTLGGKGTQYQWFLNGQPITGAYSASFASDTLNDNDVISLWVKNADSCALVDTAISNKLTMHVGTGVHLPNEVFDRVSIAPNPNAGSFTVRGTLTATGSRTGYIEVINAVGVVVYKDDLIITGAEFNKFIDLGEKANNGLHMVRITVGDRSQILKFVTSR